MPEQILEQLFESPVKLKLLKLFLRNPNRHFLLSEVIKKTQSKSGSVRKQLKSLTSIGLLRERMIRANKRKQIKGGIYFSINQDFDFYNELSTLILKSSPTSKEKMLKRILKLGRIKLALIAGVFLNTLNSRVDLFLVGDSISAIRLGNFLADMESEVGKEIEYAAMDSKEFDYRYHMFDRFVRDILEKPHEKLVNKMRFIE
jgi:hypothetical protein